MNDKQLRSFVSIVETKSFSKSEENLFLSRQAIKKQIDSLESELGVVLLVRNSKGVYPTAQGKQFYNQVKEILSSYDDLVREINSTKSEELVLNIGNPKLPHNTLNKAYVAFSQEHPEVRQNFVTIDAKTRIEYVSDGTIDVVETLLGDAFDAKTLGALQITEIGYTCFVTNTHPLAGKESVSIDELKDYKVGIRYSGNEELCNELKKHCPESNLVAGIKYEDSLMYNTCYNGGVYITRSQLSEAAFPFSQIKLETDIKYGLYVVYRKNHKLVVDYFLDTVKKIF